MVGLALLEIDHAVVVSGSMRFGEASVTWGLDQKACASERPQRCQRL